MSLITENHLVANQFHHDAELGIWLDPKQGKFAYSDGDKVEKRMLEILRNANDLSLFSAELAGKISDWPTQYHFSSARHNLLRHLRINRDTSVLELGAGCGAITRQLGETAGEVWAVEGSRTRAACAAARTRDLPNVRVFASDFQLFDPGRKFDVVTLIGVLEYSPVFFQSEDPFLECLKLARSFLRPGGVLLVAIENQLGLKYFCGAPEDHTGKPYDGVQDLYKARGVQTRGRVELTKVLHDAGFPALQFQFPFPDYKLPSWVFTERGLETPGFDPVGILEQVQPHHEGQRTKFTADERRIRAVLYRNGLLEDLANSFLVLAGDSDDSFGLSPPKLLATGYTTNRQAAFNTQTKMSMNESGQIAVEKTWLSPGLTPPTGDFVHLIGTEPYRTGPQLEQRIVEALARKGLDAAVIQLRQWIDFLIANGLASRNDEDVYASTINPIFFDCNPRNLIVTDTGLEPIDLEWRYLKPLSLRTATMLYLKPFTSGHERLLRKHLKSRDPLPLQLGVNFTRQQYDHASEQRRDINRLIMSDARRDKSAENTRSRKSFNLLHRIRNLKKRA